MRVVHLLIRVGVLLSIAGPVAAVNMIDVTTTADERNTDGDCSLREAIIAANTDAASDACRPGSGADQINLPAGTYTLTITGANEDAALTGDLDLTASAQLVGVGAVSTIITSAGTGFGDRIMSVIAGATVTMTDVTLSHGSIPTNGGGGVAVYGTLTCTRCIVRDSSAFWGGGVMATANGVVSLLSSTVTSNVAAQDGGGVYLATGTATLNGTTISANTAIDGGGIASFDGFVNARDVTLSGNMASGTGGGLLAENAITILKNVTVSGNGATTSGGGLTSRSSGTVDASNVTVTNNSSAQGGGVSRQAGSITIRNSIVAGNTASTSGPDCSSTITSDGYNLFGTAGCPGSVVTGDVSGAAADLDGLADNGGSTLTHLPSLSSPAVDAGHPGTPGTTGACIAADQRGVARPVGGRCDKGAVERGSSGTTTTSSNSTTTTTGSTTTTTSGTATSTTTTTGTASGSTATSTTTTAPSATSFTTTTGTTTTTLSRVPAGWCSQPTTLSGLRFAYVPIAPAGGAVLIKGTFDLPAAAAYDLDPARTGVLFQWSGDGAPLDLSTDVAANVVAPATACGAADGWRGLSYRNRSTAVPPGCTPESSHGLISLKLIDRRLRGRGIGFVARLRGPAVLPPPPSVAVGVVFSEGPTPEVEVPCGVGTPVACVKRGRRTNCGVRPPAVSLRRRRR